MVKIFISYKREDEVFVKQLANALKSVGLDVWVDKENIPAGSNWGLVIDNALQICNLMLLVVTPEAMSSKNVTDEWSYFVDEQKEIIPITLRPAKLNYQLRRIQSIDFHKQPFDMAFSELLRHLGIDKTYEDFSLPMLEWCIIPENGVYAKTAIQSIQAFHISKYPITQLQYQIFLDDKEGFSSFSPQNWRGDAAQEWRFANPRPKPAKFVGDHYPQEMVTWYEAQAFCLWLSRKLGKRVYLPNQYERELAVRGSKGCTYPWGNEFNSHNCNMRESHLISRTTRVDKYPSGANEYGVMDLVGNVWEWCVDEEGKPIVCGGGWKSRRRHGRANWLRYHPADYYAPDVGFRVCMEA